jgi:hypothetical protein
MPLAKGWSGCNAEQTRRVGSASALVQPDPWSRTTADQRSNSCGVPSFRCTAKTFGPRGRYL